MSAKQAPSVSSTPSLISINDVCAQTSLSRSNINLKVQAGEFPQPVTIGLSRKAFVQSEVTAWINQRIDARRGRAA